MSRRQLPACQTCARPIARHPCKRTGDQLRYCGLACSGRAKRRVGEDEILRIVTARHCGITWPTIARELGCSVNTVQRAVRRAGTPIRLPRWIERENSGQREPSSSAASDIVIARPTSAMSANVSLCPTSALNSTGRGCCRNES
jgi:Homeodomain-like domain-containing protein